jgi:hypothetical protein
MYVEMILPKGSLQVCKGVHTPAVKRITFPARAFLCYDTALVQMRGEYTPAIAHGLQADLALFLFTKPVREPKVRGL